MIAQLRHDGKAEFFPQAFGLLDFNAKTLLVVEFQYEQNPTSHLSFTPDRPSLRSKNTSNEVLHEELVYKDF